MGYTYNADYIRAYYDAYAEREWARFDETASPVHRVSYHVHRTYLDRYVHFGDRVLEVGAGPGRFTVDLARLGATIAVGDLSPRQLALNRSHVAEAGCVESVESWDEVDVCNLSRFADGTFDVTVCYGGPLSYVFDNVDVALGELPRVTREGGHVLLSVMSLVGSTEAFLGSVVDIARERGLDVARSVIDTGDLDARVQEGHFCRMYRWSRLESLLIAHPCVVVAASASSCLSTAREDVAHQIAADPNLWATFLAWEVDVCAEPGARDAGTHIIAVVRKVG